MVFVEIYLIKTIWQSGLDYACIASTYPWTLSSLLALQQRVIVKKRMMAERPAETPKNKFCTNFDPGASFSGSSMSIFAASLLIFSLMKLMLASSTLMNTMAAIWRRRIIKTQML